MGEEPSDGGPALVFLPPSCESAHAQTVIEVLTVDDDDADLSNGTPNCQDIICPAFSAHSLPCQSQDCP